MASSAPCLLLASAKTLPYAAPAVTAESAVWRSRTADGRPVVVTLTPGACNEAGEETHPLTARVEFNGRTHPGCAGPATEPASAR